ncbi:hypothetical protein [Aurantivibrio infirmus]
MQSTKKYIYVTLLLTIFLGGCAGTYKPITQYELKEYKTATVISNLPQQEIRMQIIPSNSGGAAGAQFGLLGALIGAAVDAGVNNSKANKAEESIEKFRVALRDDDISAMINRELQSQLIDLSWVSVNEFQQTSVVGSEFSDLPKENTYNSDVMILVSTDYAVTPSFETIELTADFWIYEVDEEGRVTTQASKSAGRRPKAKPFYSNQVVYQADIFPTANSKRKLTEQEKQIEIEKINAIYNPQLEAEPNRRIRDKINKQRSDEIRKTNKLRVPVDASNLNGALWLENNAELTRQALVIGSKEIAKLIAMDIRGDGSDLESLELTKSKGLKMHLIANDEENGRVIYRIREGLYPGKLISKTIKDDYLVKLGRL